MDTGADAMPVSDRLRWRRPSADIAFGVEDPSVSEADVALVGRVAAGDAVASLVSSGPAPSVGTVVSALPQDGAARYRIVAATRPSTDAEPVVPTLEGGYVLLAQQHSLTAAESAAWSRDSPASGSTGKVPNLPPRLTRQG